MKLKKLLGMKLVMAVSVWGLSLASLFAADVAQVVTRQLWPWSTDVLVTYSLTGTDAGCYDIDCSILKDGEPVSIPFGAIDWFGRFGVAPGATSSFKWDPSKTSLTNCISSNVQVSLSVTNASYIVIDVSGGPTAENYPVTVLNGIPAGGWTDDYKTTKIVLRRVPAGTFMMGSPDGEVGRDSERETLHQVTLTRDFYIGVFEITCSQCSLVTGRAESSYTSISASSNYDNKMPANAMSYNQVRGATQGARFPASSAVDADSFLGLLRAKTASAMASLSLPQGYSFDLPTDAEWEYACRAGTTTSLNNGKNVSLGVDESGVDAALAEVARYKLASDYGNVDIVGSHRPNALGLYDMHGNVEELCLDWSAVDLGSSAVTDPVGPSSAYNRLRRGGSRWSLAYRHRSASRVAVGASDAGYTWGVRLAFRPDVGQ